MDGEEMDTLPRDVVAMFRVQRSERGGAARDGLGEDGVFDGGGRGSLHLVEYGDCWSGGGG